MAVISLPSRSDFDVIFKSPDAKSSSRDFLILAKLNTKIKDHRIGFITPKKRFVALLIAIDSVELYESTLRHHEPFFPADIVVIARKTPDDLWSLTYQQFLNQSFAKLFKNLEKACGK